MIMAVRIIPPLRRIGTATSLENGIVCGTRALTSAMTDVSADTKVYCRWSMMEAVDGDFRGDAAASAWSNFIRNRFRTIRYISCTAIPLPGDSDSVIRYLQ